MKIWINNRDLWLEWVTTGAGGGALKSSKPLPFQPHQEPATPLQMKRTRPGGSVRGCSDFCRHKWFETVLIRRIGRMNEWRTVDSCRPMGRLINAKTSISFGQIFWTLQVFSCVHAWIKDKVKVKVNISASDRLNRQLQRRAASWYRSLRPINHNVVVSHNLLKLPDVPLGFPVDWTV